MNLQGKIFKILACNFDCNFDFFFRFGVTNAVITLVPIKKDEEYFVNYGYPLQGNTPTWYRDVFKQFAKENPTDRNLEYLQKIEEIEKAIEEYDKNGTPIPLK